MRPSPIAKITRPRLSKIVERERLFQLLDQERERPVLWICAPAGAGKTTLAASYLAARRLPGIWYQADEGDHDIASFFYYMGLAAKQSTPRQKTPLPLLTPEYILGIPVFTRRFFEELCHRLKSPGVIVLDNYQALPVESGFHEMLANGLEVIPEGLRVLIVSRLDPPPPFARLQANRALQLLSWDEIRFTPAESLELLRRQGRGRITEAAAAQLQQRSEGWAAGLVLLAGADGQGAGGTTLAPSASLFNYFVGEILVKEAAAQEVLLQTSFLPRFSGAEAEELTGNGAAGQILERLSRQRFFTQRYDQHYQYHPLFREFLQSRARAAWDPGEVALVQAAAAGLLERSGRGEEAIGLFIEAAAWGQAERLICTLAPQLAVQGRGGTLAGWVSCFPSAYRERSPWLQYWSAVSCLTCQPGEARSLLEKAYPIFRTANDPVGSFLAWAAIVNTYVFELGDFRPVDRWIAEFAELRRGYPEFPSAEVEMRVTQAIFCALMYRQPQHPEMAHWEERLRAIVLHGGDAHLRAILGAHLILYHTWWTGDQAKAALLLSQGEELRGRDGDPFAQIVWHSFTAAFNWVTANDEACLAAVAGGLRQAESTGIHIWNFVLLSQATWGMGGEPDAALRDHLARMGFIRSTNRRLDIAYYDYQLGWEALGRGDIALASERMESSVAATREAGAPFVEAFFLTGMAEVAIAAERYAEAEKYLADSLALGLAMGSRTVEFQHGWLSALLSWQRGDQSAALGHLARHLALGRENGMLSHPCWRPSVMAPLYALALEAGIETEHVRRLIRKRQLPPPASRTCGEWPYPLAITTLGAFGVWRDDEPLRFGGKVQRKPLELLKILIASGGGAPVERIGEALWPEADGDSAHRSFESALYRLRKLLGEKALRLHDGVLELERQQCRVDAWDFSGWVRQGRAAPRRSPEQGECFARAVDLYQGHFLPAETSQLWSLSLRERLRSDYIGVVTALGLGHEAAGEWEEAIRCFHQGLEAEELAEEFYQHLMRCHLELGQRVQAQSVYRRCRAALAQGLGLSPSRRTEELYASLRPGSIS